MLLRDTEGWLRLVRCERRASQSSQKIESDSAHPLCLLRKLKHLQGAFFRLRCSMITSCVVFLAENIHVGLPAPLVLAPIFGPPRALILSFRCYVFKARYAHAFIAENPPYERCKIAHKLSGKERAKAWTDFTDVWQEWSMVDVELGAWRRNRQKREWSRCLSWLKTTMCMIRPWRLIASDRISQRSAQNMERFADEVGKEFGVLWRWPGSWGWSRLPKKAKYGAQWTLADWKERWGETRFALPQNCAEPREASGGHRLVQAFRTNSGQCCGVAK